MNNKCCLCGGKIKDGKCVECGMPKQKASSTRITEEHKVREKDFIDFSAEKAVDSHKKQTTAKRTPPVYNTSPNKKAANRGSSRPGQMRKSGNTIGVAKVVSIFVAIVTIFSAIGGLVGGFSDDLLGLFDDGEGYEYMEDYEYDPYEYVEEELPVGTDSWSATLEPGYYEVGVHLPAGEYSAQVESGYGSLRLINDDIGLYVSESLDADEGTNDEIMDLRCYPGSILEITSELCVTLESETAVSEEMTGMENPLTETYEFTSYDSEDETFVTAGVDFPAGVYDLSSDDSYSYIRFTITMDDSEWVEYYSVSGVVQKISNITIPEGAEVAIYKKVVLTPSEVIGTDWNNEFYEKVY